MTTSCSSKVTQPIFSLQLCKTGVAYVQIGDISKNISYADAVEVIKEAIPEAKQCLDLQEGLTETSNDFKVYPKYVVKSLKQGNTLYVLLYNPAVRRRYRQKFKTSSESGFAEYLYFWEALVEAMGENTLLSVYKSLGLETSSKDPYCVDAPNYLYPSMACQVNFIKNSEGLWGFKESYYSSVRDNTYREFLQMKGTWISYFSIPGVTTDTSWVAVPSLPNFFDSGTMCFGSISRPSLLDLDKTGLAAVDFYLDAVYSSYFNTDLYSNATGRGAISLSYSQAAEEFVYRLEKAFLEVTGNPVTPHQHNVLQESSNRLYNSRPYIQHILLTMILRSE